MEAEFVLGLLKTHFGSILVFVLVAVAWKLGGFQKIAEFIDKVGSYIETAQKEIKQRKIREVAKRVYGAVNDHARALAKKTDTDKDDKVVDKLALGLEWGLKALDFIGLADDGVESELERHFRELHEAENKARDLLGKLPGAPDSSS
jgi:hypothetical protein